MGVGIDRIRTDQSLALLDVLLPKEELSIEVGQINGIEIQDSDFSETGHDYILHW